MGTLKSSFSKCVQAARRVVITTNIISWDVPALGYARVEAQVSSAHAHFRVPVRTFFRGRPFYFCRPFTSSKKVTPEDDGAFNRLPPADYLQISLRTRSGLSRTSFFLKFTLINLLSLFLPWRHLTTHLRHTSANYDKYTNEETVFHYLFPPLPTQTGIINRGSQLVIDQTDLWPIICICNVANFTLQT